ncbi:MAG: hypothetical protein H6673_08275 [Anaerolineales bacterium]|nr:hypothetical protein [Anaerolineales bacterium]
MRRSKYLIALLVLMMAILPVAQAQEGVMSRSEMIGTVISAYDNLKAAGTYSFDGTQTEYQEIASGLGMRRASSHRESERTIEGKVQLGVDGAADAVEVSIVQADETYNNAEVRSLIDFSMELDLIQADGGLFIKVNSVGGDISDTRLAAMSEADRDAANAAFPTPWVNVLQTPEQMAGYLAYLDSNHTDSTFFGSLNLESLLNLGSVPVLTPEMVVTIEQIASVNEGELVFIMTLDPAQVAATLGFSELFDARTMAGDVDAMLTEIFAGMTITQEVTILTQDDGTFLPSNIHTMLNINVSFSPDATNTENQSNPLALELIMKTESAINYSDIGRSVTITAPEIAAE